ncbi:unnamed protein product [Ceratitis capitata]|uniref:(Mediterranean fruit fly) hypothetical protein n=1 Tax=Ceratitis capitata TaxID=7213 RepID=A0A811UM59_CERCA|nr:unnamed protein product [Ceratitis capitata]
MRSRDEARRVALNPLRRGKKGIEAHCGQRSCQFLARKGGDGGGCEHLSAAGVVNSNSNNTNNKNNKYTYKQQQTSTMRRKCAVNQRQFNAIVAGCCGGVGDLARNNNSNNEQAVQMYATLTHAHANQSVTQFNA